jgi:hypothetical protein
MGVARGRSLPEAEAREDPIEQILARRASHDVVQGCARLAQRLGADIEGHLPELAAGAGGQAVGALERGAVPQEELA